MLAATDTIFIVSFAAYSLAIILVGVYSARFATNTDEDYFLGGRKLGSWVAALSASASSESGWVTLGLVGMAYTSGVQAYWILPGCLLGFAFNWFILARRLSDRSRELGAVTIPDFFAYHFKERYPILRLLSVLVIGVAMLLYVAAQFAAAGKSFSACFSGVDYRVGVVIGAAIVLVYTVTGGFRAVCWTDFLQALLMVGVLVVFPIYLLFNQGGYAFITDQLGPLAAADGTTGDMLRFWPRFDHVGGKAAFAGLGFLLGNSALGINFGYPGQPHVLVRFMALKSKKEALLGGVIAMTWGALVYWGAVTVGLMARAMEVAGHQGIAVAMQNADSEQSLVVAANTLLPNVMSGLVLAAVLAAICSTADSQVVVAASAVANDIYDRLVKRSPDGRHVWVDRVVVFALGLTAVLLVVDQKVKVYEYVLTYGWAILGAAFGPQMILALFWKRASYAGAIAGMATGFAVAVLWQNLYSNPEGLLHVQGVHIYNLPLAFMAALIVNAVVSLLAPDRTADGLAEP